MINKYYDQDCDLHMLDGKTIAIIGFGSQGHAHAMNLTESGAHVVVGLRPGSQHEQKAKDFGLEVMDIDDAAEAGDIVMMLAPDELQSKIYREHVASHMHEGNALAFAHGFNIHYQQIIAPEGVDVIMIAPKGPGHIVREQYTQGSGVPCLIAVEQNPSGKAKELALAYAAGIGAGRSGILETTFREETETDLFGEQAVLCGGVCELMKAGWETLVEAGYAPEMAYFECIHEMKMIIDLIYAKGFGMMRYSISNTAEYGDYVSGPKVITKESREGMKSILADIQSGKFASTFIQEMNAGGKANFLTMRKVQAEHPVNAIGADLRKMMSWLDDGK